MTLLHNPLRDQLDALNVFLKAFSYFHYTVEQGDGFDSWGRVEKAWLGLPENLRTRLQKEWEDDLERKYGDDE